MSAWKDLATCPDEVLGPGLVLRFRTTGVPPGRGPLVVMAVEIPGNTSVSVFVLDGNNASGYSMGYRSPTLPDEAAQEGYACSVRRDWLPANVDHVVMGVDPATIEYTNSFVVTAVEPDDLAPGGAYHRWNEEG